MSAERSSSHSIESYLALGDLRLDRWPCLTLCGITEQVHNDCTAVDSLIDVKQVRARNPAILLSFFPRRAVLSHTNNDVQAVVTQIETLTVALRAVANQR